MILDAKLYNDLELVLLRNLYDVEEPTPCSKIVAIMLDVIEDRYDLKKKQ